MWLCSELGLLIKDKIMKKYLQYLSYVLRHKWHVSLECFHHGLYWRGITHDLSKFLPDEFIPYARYFYGSYRSILAYSGDIRNKYLSSGCYAEKINAGTKDNPTFLIGETEGKYTKRGAVSIPAKNVIVIEPKVLAKKFAEKAWTKPAVEGVHPLPADEFKTLEEYVDFVKDHERAHLKFDEKLDMDPNYRGFSEADKENFMNEAVLGRDLTPKPLGGSWADVEAYRQQRLEEETRDALKNRPK